MGTHTLNWVPLCTNPDTHTLNGYPYPQLGTIVYQSWHPYPQGLIVQTPHGIHTLEGYQYGPSWYQYPQWVSL
jgi:hypothetical protein